MIIVQPAPADASTLELAVVLLADTALADLGGLGDVAFTLLGARATPQPPRRPEALSAELRAAWVGEYELQPGVHMRLRDDGQGRLPAQVTGPSEFEQRADDRGVLYPLVAAAVATPQGDALGKVQHLVWRQGGGITELRRVGVVASAATATHPAWVAWAGEYELLPGLVLRIYEQDGDLMGQATAQMAVELTPTGTDRVETRAHGISIRFSRDASGQVAGMEFRQGGQTIQAKKR